MSLKVIEKPLLQLDEQIKKTAKNKFPITFIRNGVCKSRNNLNCFLQLNFKKITTPISKPI